MTDQDRAAQVRRELRDCFDWDNQLGIIAAYGQEQRRAGVEAMRDAVVKEWDGYNTRCGIVCLLAKQLLTQTKEK